MASVIYAGEVFVPDSDFSRGNKALHPDDLDGLRSGVMDVLRMILRDEEAEITGSLTALSWRYSGRFLSIVGMSACEYWERAHPGQIDPYMKELLWLMASFHARTRKPPSWWNDGEVHLSHQDELMNRRASYLDVWDGGAWDAALLPPDVAPVTYEEQLESRRKKRKETQ